MSTDGAFLWTNTAIQELQQWRRSLPSMIQQMINQAVHNSTATHPKDLISGVTVGYNPATNTENPAFYPTKPANTFWVKLGKPSYTPVAGNQLLSLTPYSPTVYRLAHEPQDNYIEIGTNVWISNHHDQYYIVGFGGGEGGSRLFLFQLTTTFLGGSGDTMATANIYEPNVGISGTPVAAVTLYDNTLTFTNLPNGSVGLCLFQDGFYHIIQAKCPVEFS
jgi:hypothetical protein